MPSCSTIISFSLTRVTLTRPHIACRSAAGRIESVSLNAELEKVQVQARQPGPIENLKELQTELDLFADELHGEYDGWQVPGVTEHL